MLSPVYYYNMSENIARRKRINLIKQIENQRSSKLISYITGDRAPFTTQIADDAVRIIRKHLDAIGGQDRISLFLYSKGGDMVTPLRLCRLIREYSDNFEVLIPYRAYSAATLICLGADKIIMGKSSELSPIDPSTGHPFNPIDPSDPKKQKRFTISVEDLTSYFLLAKEKAEVRNEQMVNVFNELANKIHPLALGNVYRGYRMIRDLAKKLLLLHMDKERDKHRMDEIIKKLTEELCIHGYLITRDEAKREIGLNVEQPEEALERLMWHLYEEYEEKMKLRDSFDPLGMLKDKQSVPLIYYGAYIESVSISDTFLFKGEIEKVTPPSGPPQAGVNIRPVGWVEMFKGGG